MSGNGLDHFSAGELRRLVREVLAEVLQARADARGDEGAAANGQAGSAASGQAAPGRPPGTVLGAGGVPSGIPAGRPVSPAAATDAGPRPPAAAAGEALPGSWDVRIVSDADLHEFALRVLKLADNPKQRRDLVAGRIRFRLAVLANTGLANTGLANTGPAGGQRTPDGPAPPAVHRVDKGAVTERTVAAAAAAGARLLLGPRAVLTPLGKDKARALGVPVDKER